METIAVYWEAQVKVYGITGKSGLALGVLRFHQDRMASWAERITHLESTLRRFELVTCHGTDKDRMELYLVIENDGRDAMLSLMNRWLEEEPAAQFSMNAPFYMIFLHGPHFQDRFGIAETAFSILAKHNIQITLSGCAGTSMYLIFPEDQGAAALKILKETFLIPTTA
ncbi:MAG: hypothetical protein VR65_23020 [Desulfobulbaceae bacterium BRH_c16a]|nr:MAG: hypothetical protein VR65_23020 [Desulfobulbaceae bacterium BRH_c16a]